MRLEASSEAGRQSVPMPNSLPPWVRPYKKSFEASLTIENASEGSTPISSGAANRTTLLRIALAWILIVALGAPAYSDQASAAYDRGVRAEAKPDYDAAFEGYAEAYRLKPKETKYIVPYLRVRGIAAEEHVRKGQLLRDNLKLQEALLEFQRAAAIDPTNLAAGQEAQRASDMIKKQAEGVDASKAVSQLAKIVQDIQGPVELEPFSDTPLTLRMTTTSDNVYKTIGKLAGINVLFDLDYRPQRINIELDEVPLREALRMVAMQSKTFWRPISTKAIFVAAESKRKEYEDNVMTTFYIRNASTPAELQEVVGTLKGMLDITRVQLNPTHGTITIRGTPDQMVLAQKLITDLDKPKAEVVIDIAILEVSTDRLRDIGTTVPTSTSIALQAAAAGPGTVNIGGLNGGTFSIAVPGGSFSFLMSDSNTKVLQNPRIRVLDNGKATLKIGDRVPIATGSFSSATSSGGGVSPLVNTQFQYLDVGVNIDITPHVLSGGEVSLKMVLEVSSVTGSTNIGGISQPTIGQRHIEHETRLGDGEMSLVGGILTDSETQSLGGYPWILNIPLLKYLFGDEKKDRRKTEIVFAVIPHIVRSEDITDESMRVIDIGTGTAIDLRRPESTKKPASPSQPGKPASQGETTPKSPVTTPARPSTPAPPPA
jgi:general secretion pathway protein D